MTPPNNTPPPITKDEIAVLWQSSRLKITDSFATPPEILNVGDSVIGTLGNFSASTGKAKSKKTFNITAIVAAAMVNGTVLRYRANLPADKAKILYCGIFRALHIAYEVGHLGGVLGIGTAVCRTVQSEGELQFHGCRLFIGKETTEVALDGLLYM